MESQLKKHNLIQLDYYLHNFNTSINLQLNNLCEEYHYECIDSWSPQDQSNCP